MSSRSGTTTKLFVGNVKEGSQSSDLRALFERYGKIAECDIVKDYAFVHFYEADDAEAALAALDSYVFEGGHLRVQMSRSRLRQKAGMGGEASREVCFKCGKEGHWSRDCFSKSGTGGKPRGYSDDRASAPRPPRHADAAEDPHGAARRDPYRPHPPVGGATISDRYHPYDRRPPPTAAGYAGPPDYAGYPRGSYAVPDDYRDVYYPSSYDSRTYDKDKEEEPLVTTDELGRPPPEYYKHRLKDAYYELVQDSNSNRGAAAVSAPRSPRVRRRDFDFTGN